ncbi:MAG: nucleotidyl transferase AbiEii/AbiGii toxin family protein [Prolixibacteraceae bacterium]|nr:nucleotidyl transferase AbiEii/AbiGii toxin family protein [Prolixibacteraceae bacterium]
MGNNRLNSFILVGGTALALRLGHRISIDIDLFTTKPFNSSQMANLMRLQFNMQIDFMAENTLKGEIDGVAVDILAHQYPWNESAEEVNGIRLARLSDIAAMKLNAISGDGTRLKDFTDIAFLSSKLSLNEMLACYKQKYNSNPVIPLKALVYFDDIDFNVPINLTGNQVFNWDKIEKRLLSMVNEPDKVFENLYIRCQ